jgi:hypothetical protein
MHIYEYNFQNNSLYSKSEIFSLYFDKPSLAETRTTRKS